MKTIQRDSYARADLVRDIVLQAGRKPCLWCGQEAKFLYAWVPDSIQARPVNWSGPFCSVSCYRTFNA